jgi:hypothetical protein
MSALSKSNQQRFGAWLALVSLFVLVLAQWTSARHMVAQLSELKAGEVLVCSVNGPLKISLADDLLPKVPKPQKAEHCPLCTAASVPVVVLAGLLLGVFDVSEQRIQSPVDQQSPGLAAPDKRHAPSHAPPIYS